MSTNERFFVDTVFIQAILNPRDQHSNKAMMLYQVR
jgi:hypothetical protein